MGSDRWSIEVVGDDLVIDLGWRDGLLACRRRLRIPVAAIKGVAAAPRHLVPATGWRLPGTSFPGVIRAGSYGTGPKRDFWFVRQAERVLVIELEAGESYRRVVLEVDDPHAEALRLRPLVGAFTGTFR